MGFFKLVERETKTKTTISPSFGVATISVLRAKTSRPAPFFVHGQAKSIKSLHGAQVVQIGQVGSDDAVFGQATAFWEEPTKDSSPKAE